MQSKLLNAAQLARNSAGPTEAAPPTAQSTFVLRPASFWEKLFWARLEETETAEQKAVRLTRLEAEVQSLGQAKASLAEQLAKATAAHELAQKQAAALAAAKEKLEVQDGT